MLLCVCEGEKRAGARPHGTKTVRVYWFLKVREVPKMSVGRPVPGTEQLSSK